MPSDDDEDNADLTGVEAVLGHFTEVRKDTQDLILVLEEQRNRKKKRSPPGTNTPSGSDA